MRNLLLTLAAFAACLSGCKHDAKTVSNEIVVGEYGSLTGSEATFGQSTHNGLSMAVAEINASGGIKTSLGVKKVKLVNYDDQGKTSEVGTAVTRLIAEDNALAVIGEVASSLSIAGGQICQQQGVPMISPSSTNPKVTETGDYIFRVCFIDPFQGYVMARFATNPKGPDGLGVKKIAILVDQRQAYSQGLAQYFADALKKLGGQVVATESYQGGDQDFSAQLTRIRDKHPDAIYLPGYYTDVANIAKQARGLGLTAPLLGGDGWESVQNIGGPAVEGAYFSNHYSADEKRPEVQHFVDKYTKQYGASPDSMAALGYDSMMLLKNAIERAPASADLAAWRKNVRDALASTKGFQGVTGKITIDKDRNATKPAVVLKIVDKHTVTQTSISPE